MQKSITIVVMVLATVLLSCNGQAPTFPKMWHAFETITNFNGQHGSAEVYFDETNQREAAFSNTSAYGLVITDYKANGGDGKVYYIKIYGGARHCMLWCEPDTPTICDAGDSLCQPAMPKATNDGTAVVNGVDTTIYKWGDNLGPIPMNELYLYVSDKTKKPVQMIRDLHPFGKELGNLTIDYTNFEEVSSIPASVWDIGSYKGNCNTPSPSDQCASNQFMQQIKNLFN